MRDSGKKLDSLWLTAGEHCFYSSFWVFLWLKKDSIKTPWRQWSILNAHERIKSRNHNTVGIYPYIFRLNKAFLGVLSFIYSLCGWDLISRIHFAFCSPRCNPFSFKINAKVKEGTISMEESYFGPSDSWNQIDTLQLQWVQRMHHQSDRILTVRNHWSSYFYFFSLILHILLIFRVLLHLPHFCGRKQSLHYLLPKEMAICWFKMIEKGMWNTLGRRRE